jgi:hypothetical protein
MDKNDMFWSFVVAVVASWLSAMGRIIRVNGVERRRMTLADMLIETPSAVACGIMGGGIAALFGITNPLVIAAFGAVAGHIGSMALIDLIIRFIKKRIE